MVEFLGVKCECVVGCELGRGTTLRGVGTRGDDVEATFVDVNYCLGVCLVFFRNKIMGEMLLYIGDF